MLFKKNPIQVVKKQWANIQDILTEGTSVIRGNIPNWYQALHFLFEHINLKLNEIELSTVLLFSLVLHNFPDVRKEEINEAVIVTVTRVLFFSRYLLCFVIMMLFIYVALSLKCTGHFPDRWTNL